MRRPDGLRRAGISQGGRGVVAVELALILPFLLLLLTALFDIGFAAYEAMEVQAAAAAGGEYAMLYPFPWDQAKIDQIAAVVEGSAIGSSGISQITASPQPYEFCACATSGSLAPVNCASICPDNNPPSVYAEVNAQMKHFTVLSYPALPDPLTLTGRAIVRLQ